MGAKSFGTQRNYDALTLDRTAVRLLWRPEMWTGTPGLDWLTRRLDGHSPEPDIEEANPGEVPDLLADNDNLREITRARNAVRSLRRDAKALDAEADLNVRNCEADVCRCCLLVCSRIIGGQKRDFTEMDRACLEQLLGLPIRPDELSNIGAELRANRRLGCNASPIYYGARSRTVTASLIGAIPSSITSKRSPLLLLRSMAIKTVSARIGQTDWIAASLASRPGIFNHGDSSGERTVTQRQPDPKAILELYHSGMSTNKIGGKLGFHKSRISKIVKEAGELRFRTLTNLERKTAVEKYVAGESAPKIAEQLGVTSPAIYLALKKHGIARRHNWSKEEAIRHDFFSKIDTPHKAYRLGFLVADGCVSRKAEIIIALKGIDVGHLALWRETVGSKRRITRSEKMKSFGTSHWFYKGIRFGIKSNQMAADLFDLGVIPAKTGRTVYPKGMPGALEVDFWRGAVDGDGSLFWGKAGVRQQFSLGLTGNRELISEFWAFCRKHVPTNASIQPNGSILKFVVSDSYAYRIAKLLYGSATVASRRKRKVFLSAMRRFERGKKTQES